FVGDQQWLGRRRLWSPCGDGPSNAVHTHWPADVLDLLLAHILKGEIDFVTDLITHNTAYTDPAGGGQCLQPRGNVHPVAEDVVRLNNPVAEIDADAELDALFRGGCPRCGRPSPAASRRRIGRHRRRWQTRPGSRPRCF